RIRHDTRGRQRGEPASGRRPAVVNVAIVSYCYRSAGMPGVGSMGEMTANVLIVDDDPSIRLLFRRAFEREGADVEEAEDGDGGIDAAVGGLPDLVVIAVAVPRRDGLSVLPELGSRCLQAPVLSVPAFGNPGAIDEAGRAATV